MILETAAVEKLVRPPSPPRHEIVTTMGKVANIRHCVATGHWLSHWSQTFYKIATFELPEIPILNSILEHILVIKCLFPQDLTKETTTFHQLIPLI